MRHSTVGLQASTEDDLRTLTAFAEFWKIPSVTDLTSNDHQVIMSSGGVPLDRLGNCAAIVSPAGPENAKQIAQRLNLGLETRTTRVHLPFSRTAETSMTAVTYNFKGAEMQTVIDSDGIPILSRLGATKTYLLSIDLASEYSIRLSSGLEDPPSLRFRIATQLPFSYRMIPSFIRNRAFRSDEQPVVNEKLAPVECLRTVFLASLVTVLQSPIPFIAFWKRGKRFAMAVTHDVETSQGLVHGSENLLGVEEDLRIRSTWNIVTNRYELTRENLKPLRQFGEIGAHDTDHDGRLIFLPTEDRIKRLRQCREALERLTDSRVKGFRAPLLQHDRKLLRAVGMAGYEFDSSVPSWEILSPTSLKSHGVGTVFPLEVEGIVETPVSLPQDHQLLRVKGLTPNEAGNTLIQVSEWLREIGGLCTLLIHPDYDFAAQAHSQEYSRILRTFTGDPSCQSMTLGEASEWWSLRASTFLESTDEGVSVNSTRAQECQDFRIQIATAYDKSGFAMVDLN